MVSAIFEPEAPAKSELRFRQFEPKIERLSVQKFTSFDAVRGLREKWDQLAEDVGADLFASFDWCSTWWAHYRQDRELEIYIASEGSELVGCVPFYRETLSYGPWRLFSLRLLGAGDAGTRCHLAVRQDKLPEVLSEVCRQIDQGGSWDVLHLGDMPSNTSQAAEVAQSLNRAYPTRRVIFRSGHCPTATYELPRTYEQYLDLLSPKERSSIRRTHRRLLEDHGAKIVPTSVTELDGVFDHFLQQHSEWWGRKGQLGYFRSWPGLGDYHRDFSRVQARSGRLHLLALKAGGRTVAYYYGHQFGRRIHAFSGSRSCDARWDALSPGKQLHCEMVRAAIAAGVTHIDSMDGYYQYKQLWGASYHRLQSVTVLSESLVSRIGRRDFLLASRMHHLWNRLWFWHAAPWLRQRFPKSRSSWLRAGLGSLYLRSRFLECAVDSGAADAICLLGAI